MSLMLCGRSIELLRQGRKRRQGRIQAEEGGGVQIVFRRPLFRHVVALASLPLKGIDLRFHCAAGCVIRHRQSKHDGQPNKTNRGEQPGEGTAVADVHEYENDQEHFDDGDGQGDESTEDAQIDVGRPPGQEQKNHQDRPN